MATVAEIALRIRQRTDNEHSTSDFVDPTELIGLIDVHYKELYGLLVRFRQHQTENIQTITATGAATYAVDSHYAIVAVFRVDGTNRITLGKHDWRFKQDPSIVGLASTYRIANGAIEFAPVPATGTYEIRYIPRPTVLDDDADIVDGVLGWEEYIVYAGARDVYTKEGNLDAAGSMESGRQRMEDRIKTEAANEEMTQSNRIQDVRSRADSVFLEGAYVGMSGVRGGWYRPWWRR